MAILSGTKRQENKKSIPFITTSIHQDFILAILLIPLWWILGVKFFIFHLIALLAFMKVLLKKRKTNSKIIFPAEIYLLLIFTSVYFISLFINLRNIPALRLLASVNSLSFWIMGVLIVIAVHNSIDKDGVLSLLGAMRALGIIYGVYVLLAYLIWIVGHKFIRIKGPAFYILPDELIDFILQKALLLKSSLWLTIIGKDKIFQRPFPRTPGFNVYGTALGATMLFLVVMTLAYYKIKKKRGLLPVVLALEIAALLLSLSRMSVLSLILAGLIVYTISPARAYDYRLILGMILIGIILVLIIIPPQKVIQTFSEFRRGSTYWRGTLYKMTLTQSLEKPFLGHGYKPKTEKVPIAIGSHSTYLGILFRTGFFGLITFLLFWLNVLRKWWNERKSTTKDPILGPLWFYSGIAMFGGLFWMMTEDLDAPPIVAFIYFLIIGLIGSIPRWRREDKSA